MSPGTGASFLVTDGASRERRPRYFYFVDGLMIYRQELVLEPGDQIGPGHRQLLHTGGWLIEWWDAAKKAGVDLTVVHELGGFANQPGSTERYMLPLVLHDPEAYEHQWEHVDPDLCPGCRACQAALVAEIVERHG